MKTKDKIISTAIDLFSKHGYHGVPVRKITGRVGIRESSLYKHFKGKEDLLDAIFDQFLELRLSEGADQTPGGFDPARSDLLTCLVESLNARFREMDRHPIDKIFRILMNEQYRVERARKIVSNELLERPVMYYRELFEQKLGPAAGDPDLLARQYYYPLFTWTYMYSLAVFDKKDGVAIKQKMFEHADAFVKRLSR